MQCGRVGGRLLSHTGEPRRQVSGALLFSFWRFYLYGLIQTNKLGCYFCLMVLQSDFIYFFLGTAGADTLDILWYLFQSCYHSSHCIFTYFSMRIYAVISDDGRWWDGLWALMGGDVMTDGDSDKQNRRWKACRCLDLLSVTNNYYWYEISVDFYIQNLCW